jgi:hypothetical protein
MQQGHYRAVKGVRAAPAWQQSGDVNSQKVASSRATSWSGCADLRPVGGTFLTFFLAEPGLYAKHRFEKVGDGYAVLQVLFRSNRGERRIIYHA